MGSGVGKTSRDSTLCSTTFLTRSTTIDPITPQRHLSTSSSQTTSKPRGPHPSSSSQTNDAEMVCEACSANFTLFKRKHRCLDCEKNFCVNCIHKEPRKCCFTCRVFEGRLTRGDIMKVQVKDLKQYLLARNISFETCREKNELVDLIVEHLGLQITAARLVPQVSDEPTSTSTTDLPGEGQGRPETLPTSTSRETIPITEPNFSTRPAPQSTSQHSVHVYGETDLGPMRRIWNEGSTEDPPTEDPTTEDPPSESSGNSQGMEEPEFPEIINIPTQGTIPTTETQSQEQTQQSQTATDAPRMTKQRASISDLKSALDVESLSIKQLKEILARNFVNYKGCVERYELEERVTRLYTEKEIFRQKEEKLAADTKESTEGGVKDVFDLDPDLCCKICMDAPIDCVLLECGHMVTCSKCGKRLAECPICRQYVVRAVHVFKS